VTDAQLRVIADLQRLLIGAAELTPHDVAAGAGVDIEPARRLWRALGFPPVRDDERFFTRSDVEMLRAACALIEREGTDPKVLLQLTRVTGQSLARIAEAQIASMADRLEQAAGHLQGAELSALVQSMLPGVEPFLSYVWRRHLLAALRRFTAGLHASGSETHVVAVGFADLVGFTAISQQVDEHQLAEIVDRFEELAYDHIAQGGGRVIKMIGDEVMFAADSAADAARVALELVRAYASDEKLPEVRVGLALGPALSWQGDLFGPIVNLASRLVNIARPSTVLRESLRRGDGPPGAEIEARANGYRRDTARSFGTSASQRTLSAGPYELMRFRLMMAVAFRKARRFAPLSIARLTVLGSLLVSTQDWLSNVLAVSRRGHCRLSHRHPNAAVAAVGWTALLDAAWSRRPEAATEARRSRRLNLEMQPQRRPQAPRRSRPLE